MSDNVILIVGNASVSVCSSGGVITARVEYHDSSSFQKSEVDPDSILEIGNKLVSMAESCGGNHGKSG